MAYNSLYNLYSIDATYIHKQQPLDFDDSGQETEPTYRLWEIVIRLREQKCGNNNQILYDYLHESISIIPALGMEQKKFKHLKETQDEDYKATLKGELIGNAISELKIGRNKTYLPYLLAWLWHDHADVIKNFYTKIDLEHREFPRHNDLVQIKKEKNNRQPENTLASTSVSSHLSFQPQLTIPQADEENKNYYASTAIKKVIGRTAQEKRLENFLNCDMNVAWFQLAGEAGQGKSRLAFDLMYKAFKLDWSAGFVEEDDIEFFRIHWKDWQPNKNHLLIFDYVIGREETIKSILKALLLKHPNERKYQHNIRILLLERQRWDRGNPIKKQDQNSNDELSISAHIGDKASWFLRLCKDVVKNNFQKLD